MHFSEETGPLIVLRLVIRIIHSLAINDEEDIRKYNLVRLSPSSRTK